MEELDEVDPARGAILSGAVKMLPVEEPDSAEDLGVGGGQIPVRLIDNIVLDPVS
jgi:pantoate--beta-alanine ligase